MMEQENSNLDRIFKEKLHDYQAEPTAGSWKAIADALDQKQKAKTRQMISYSIAASVALVIIGSFILLQFNKAKQDTIAINDVSKSPTVIAKKKDVAEPSKAPSNKGSSEITTQKEVANLEIRQKTKGLKKEITLPDGSKVHLNRHSEITYEENFTQNRIINLKGEAYFEVKHQNGNPFIVFAHLSKTEVVGTTFLIKSYGNGEPDEIYVTSGKVKFGSISNDSDKQLLTIGVKGIVEANRNAVKQNIKEANFAAWKHEKIVFDNTKVDEVIATLEKYFAVSIEVSNPEILNCRFTGTFEKSDINEILQVLSVTFNLSYNQKEGKYLLSGKGCK